MNASIICGSIKVTPEAYTCKYSKVECVWIDSYPSVVTPYSSHALPLKYIVLCAPATCYCHCTYGISTSSFIYPRLGAHSFILPCSPLLAANSMYENGIIHDVENRISMH